LGLLRGVAALLRVVHRATPCVLADRDVSEPTRFEPARQVPRLRESEVVPGPLRVGEHAVDVVAHLLELVGLQVAEHAAAEKRARRRVIRPADRVLDPRVALADVAAARTSTATAR